MEFLRRLLDPALGARVRAVLRAGAAIGAFGAHTVNADAVVEALLAAQALLSFFVLVPTAPPSSFPPPAGVPVSLDPPKGADHA